MLVSSHTEQKQHFLNLRMIVLLSGAHILQSLSQLYDNNIISAIPYLRDGAEHPIMTPSEVFAALALEEGIHYVVTKGREPSIYRTWCVVLQ